MIQKDKRIRLREIARNGIGFPDFTRGGRLFRRSPVGPGPFQGAFHFLDGNDIRVVIDRIDLLPVPESPLHLLDSLQPLQGCFSDVISVYVKDRPGKISPLSLKGDKGGQDHGDQSDGKKDPFHFYYLSFSIRKKV